jgi:hypothetical protein
MGTSAYHFVKTYSEKLSPSRYQELLLARLDAINQARKELVTWNQSLSTHEGLRPVECDELSSSLLVFLGSLRLFDDLLKDGTKLPDNVIPKRYQMYITLSNAREDAHEALPLISSYRTVCLDSSREAFELLSELKNQLNLLLKTGECLEMETEEMLTNGLSGIVTRQLGPLDPIH